MKTFATTLVALAGLCSALAGASVIERVASTRPWKRSADARGNEAIELVFALAQDGDNLRTLETALYAVSDPDSPLYGKHLSKSQVDKLAAATPEAVDAVSGWLRSEGLTPVRMGSDLSYIGVNTTIDVAERLLSADYGVYEHPGSSLDVTLLRTEEYSLPDAVAAHVDFASPTTRFPAIQRATVRLPTESQLRGGNNSFGVTPDSIRSEYKIGSAKTTNAGSRQAVASFLGQFYAPSDLAAFFKQFYPSVSGNTPVVHGPNTASNPGIEASLDIEYIMSIGAGAATQFWSTAGQQPHSPQNEPFLKWLFNVGNMSTAEQPNVISVSYGDNEPTVYLPYAKRVNVEFQKLGARGISIMYSSGDGGVSGGQPSQCTTFVPTFPAGSPYVTAVGGTTNGLFGSTESAASLSAGGFSNYWARPSYQDAAVKAYLNSGASLPASNLYNHTGAGIPDVAALATGFNIIYSGFGTLVDGTSCASPTFSGVMSLLIDARLNAGKSPMGWLNPWLYKNAGNGFNDITSGSNPGCGTNGFPATKGWDPVTGWGSPNYEALKAIVLSLP